MLTEHLTTTLFNLEPGREFPISKTGTFILCNAADGLFDVKVDDHVSLQDFKPGLTYKSPPGQVFQTVTLRNRSANIVTGVIAIGHGELGSNATLGAITIDSKSTVKTAALSDDTLNVSQWSPLAANTWMAVPAAPRSAVCLIAEGAKLLWRKGGIITPAPWDGMVAPTPDAWLKTSAGFEFCVTTPAKVTLYERLYAGIYEGADAGVPSPLSGGGGALLGYYEADADTLILPAFQGDTFAMLIGCAGFKNAPTGDGQTWTGNIVLKLDGLEVCRMTNTGYAGKYHTESSDNATQIIGRALSAGAEHTVKLEASGVVREKITDYKLRVFVYAK